MASQPDEPKSSIDVRLVRNVISGAYSIAVKVVDDNGSAEVMLDGLTASRIGGLILSESAAALALNANPPHTHQPFRSGGN